MGLEVSTVRATAAQTRETRHRVDIDGRSKLVIDDILERGLYRDQQEVMAAALLALQTKVASETYTDEYDDEAAQAAMDDAQLAPEDR